MSTPIMMVRKIKNNPQKNSEVSESKKNIKLIIPEDLKSNLARTMNSSQGPIILNKSRSSSNIKKIINTKLCQNITPLRKMRNLSFIVGNTPDISELPSMNTSIDDHKHRILGSLEGSLAEIKKNGKKEDFFEVLRKIPMYDPCLKRVIDEVISGIQCEEGEEDCESLKKALDEVKIERNKLKKDLDRCKEVFKFMKKKKEIPVEKYFMEFNETESKLEKKKKKEMVRGKSVPKLNVAPSGEAGFHQEFMSKINEFSDSWRELIRNEKNL